MRRRSATIRRLRSRHERRRLSQNICPKTTRGIATEVPIAGGQLPEHGGSYARLTGYRVGDPGGAPRPDERTYRTRRNGLPVVAYLSRATNPTARRGSSTSDPSRVESST